MALESGTYISDLNASNPVTGDNVSQGDDHIRLIKTCLNGTFPNFAGAAMSATEAELSILDGATLTTAELNTLDVSAQAVTGFTYSNLYFIDDDGDSQGGDIFNIQANIGAAWESIGPTGSGADNIWTALDALPSNTKYVEVTVLLNSRTPYNTTGGVYLSARRNGASSGTANTIKAYARAFTTESGATTIDNTSVTTFKIPVTSQIFDLYVTTTATATLTTGNMYFSGFGV